MNSLPFVDAKRLATADPTIGVTDTAPLLSMDLICVPFFFRGGKEKNRRLIAGYHAPEQVAIPDIDRHQVTQGNVEAKIGLRTDNEVLVSLDHEGVGILTPKSLTN